MKVFFALLISWICISPLVAQIEAQPQEEYVVIDTLTLSLTTKDCRKYTTQSMEKMRKFTARLQKANNRYLYLYMNQEDLFLHSLCTFQIVNMRNETMPLLDLKAPTFQSNINNIDNSIKPIGMPNSKKEQRVTRPLANLNHDSTLPKYTPESEDRAEALMFDAWLSFNRFENKCSRERMKKPGQYFGELDSIGRANEYLLTNCRNCDDQKFEALKQEQQNLQMEIKRSELINDYINSRYKYMMLVMSDVPLGQLMLLPIKKVGYYFNAQFKENISIFNDRSPAETKVMSLLNKLPGFAQFMDFRGTLNIGQPNLKSIENLTAMSKQPKLNIDQLMENAPKESKEFLTALKGKSDNGTSIEKISTDAKEILDSDIDKENQLNGKKDSLLIKNDELKSTSDSLKIKKKEKEKNWQPNPLKTKRFIDRINFNANLQCDRKNSFLPSSSTFYVGLSYQYHKNGNIGVGTSYIQPFPRINLRTENNWNIPTTSGYGFRLFADFKVKKSLYTQCGYERNYRPYLGNVSHFENSTIMMPSVLAGLKIIYPVKNKKSNPSLEFLYDFLHSQTGQPAFVLRTGVTIKGKHHLN